MNNMIFSYSGKPHNDIPTTSSKLFNVEVKKVKQYTNAENTNMLFSNKSSLHGSMFQRIQYVTSGCSACGK